LKRILKSEDMLASERFLKSLKREGRQEGRQEERQEVVLNIYIETGWTSKKIAEITKFSEAYIQSVIDKFDKGKKL
jgi:predicted transposase YdaD